MGEDNLNWVYEIKRDLYPGDYVWSISGEKIKVLEIHRGHLVDIAYLEGDSRSLQKTHGGVATWLICKAEDDEEMVRAGRTYHR